MNARPHPPPGLRTPTHSGPRRAVPRSTDRAAPTGPARPRPAAHLPPQRSCVCSRAAATPLRGAQPAPGVREPWARPAGKAGRGAAPGRGQRAGVGGSPVQPTGSSEAPGTLPRVSAADPRELHNHPHFPRGAPQPRRRRSSGPKAGLPLGTGAPSRQGLLVRQPAEPPPPPASPSSRPRPTWLSRPHLHGYFDSFESENRKPAQGPG